MRRQAGFTLTELMVVVAILGILSAVALMSFRRYTMRVRVGEAYSFLGQIKARQEVYRAEFSQYCPTNATGWFPGGDPGVVTLVWDTALAPASWLMMGVKPDRDVWFQYNVTAGPPGGAPLAPDGVAVPWNPALPQDFWFVAQARGDLDGDNTNSMFELCSECRAIFVSQAPPYEFEGR